MDLARRGHPLIAVWVWLAVHGYLRPGEGMSLQMRNLVPPLISVRRYLALPVFSNERSRSKVREADNSIILHSKWAQWMVQVLEV